MLRKRSRARRMGVVFAHAELLMNDYSKGEIIRYISFDEGSQIVWLNYDYRKTFKDLTGFVKK